MKKKLFIFLIFVFIFLFFQKKTLAQELVSTSALGSLNNPCKNITSDQILNNISLPRFSAPDDQLNSNKWGCINLLILQPFCMSDLFDSAKKSVNEFLNIDELTKELGNFSLCDPGLEPEIRPSGCVCVDPNKKNLNKISDWFCNKYIQGTAREKLQSNEFLNCSNCFSNGGYYSGIGCVYFGDWQEFFEKNIFGTLIGLAGFIALICIIYSAFQLQLSQGNPEKIKKAQELLTSCIVGLMLIIFSVFILKVIGVDILRIPGFGR